MDGELFSGASKKMISESSVDARKENWHENMSKGSNFWIIGLSTLGSFQILVNIGISLIDHP